MVKEPPHLSVERKVHGDETRGVIVELVQYSQKGVLSAFWLLEVVWGRAEQILTNTTKSKKLKLVGIKFFCSFWGGSFWGEYIRGKYKLKEPTATEAD